jgi:hypothetical protein
VKAWRTVLVALLFCGGQASAVAQSALPRAPQLVGTWRLVATQQRLADGTVRPEPGLGPRGVGYVMYSDTGRVCAVLSNPDRPKWKSQNAPAEAELQAAFDGLVAYCGSYEVNETDGYILHHVEMDKVPNLAGTDRKRYFTLSGNRLVLRPSPLPEGIKEWAIEWERVVNK